MKLKTLCLLTNYLHPLININAIMYLTINTLQIKEK